MGGSLPWLNVAFKVAMGLMGLSMAVAGWLGWLYWSRPQSGYSELNATHTTADYPNARPRSVSM
eukprot:NODE_7823_length_306_cov_19.202335_g7085_i0.p2 GENE.NODE_7823_length_306_cov_19.202335_g7085_i0~~NODE_7823_length_306_cov_19.202335_g7085_i0.p2  ORF type:complete len:64 (-),score=11.14 NODE_7823_length_306_cov_19.202335_g7085_i0:87-278(-)